MGDFQKDPVFHAIQQRPLFLIPELYKTWQWDRSGNGSGSMGIVRIFRSPDGSGIAIKKYYNLTESEDSAKRQQLVQRELQNIAILNHANIVRHLGVYIAEKELYHVTQYCGRPLKQVIEKEQYSMQHVKKWTHELLSALEHSHEKNILHRNVHPDNICIDANNKLTLLGFAKSRFHSPKNTNQALTQERGQQPYMPLECLVPWIGAYDEKVDIWSVAVILCEMITGQPLFTGPHVKNSMKRIIEYCGEIGDNVLRKMEKEVERKQLGEHSRKCERKDFFGIVLATLQPGRGISQADVRTYEHTLRPLLDSMLQYDSADRYSATQCLQHQFFA